MDAEVALEFHVDPVVHGVAECVRHGFCKCLELVARTGVSGDELLTDAVRPQQPPLVVVVTEPHISDVVPALILCNFPWRKVVVVVDDWLLRSDLMIKSARVAGFEEKVFVQIGHGGDDSRAKKG